MAGQSISITRGPTTITATAVQPGKEALDLLGLAGMRFDFNLRAIYLTDPSATVQVYIETSMTNDDNPGNWSQLVVFTAITASNENQVESIASEVLRYVRWKVTISGGTSPSLTFEVLGMVW
jgi:hypothetical protein